MNTFGKSNVNEVEVRDLSVLSVENKEQDSKDRDEARELAARWVNGSPEEKKLLRKLDWRIIVRRTQFVRPDLANDL